MLNYVLSKVIQVQIPGVEFWGLSVSLPLAVGSWEANIPGQIFLYFSFLIVHRTTSNLSLSEVINFGPLCPGDTLRDCVGAGSGSPKLQQGWKQMGTLDFR